MSSQKLSVLSSESWGSGYCLLFSSLCVFSCPPDRPPSHFWSLSRRGGRFTSSCTGFGHVLCCAQAADSSNTPSPSLFFVSPPLLCLYFSKPFCHSPPPPKVITKLPTMVASSDPCLLAYIPLHQAGLVCVTYCGNGIVWLAKLRS